MTHSFPPRRSSDLSSTPIENADAVTFGDARSVILHNKLDHIVVLHDGHKDAAPAIFGGVLDQIAQHFIQVLPFHANYGCRSEEHTSELQSLMRISYAVFCLKKKKSNKNHPAK